jgi:hypothetical protein
VSRTRSGTGVGFEIFISAPPDALSHLQPHSPIDKTCSKLHKKLGSELKLILFTCKQLSRYGDGLWAGRPGLNFRQGKEVCFYSTASRRALGSTQPPIQWIPWALSPGIKRPEREADHAPQSNAKSRTVELCLHSPIRLRDVMLN